MCFSHVSPCIVHSCVCGEFVCCLGSVCVRVCVRSAVFGIVPEVLRILANWVSFESFLDLSTRPSRVLRVRIHTS